MSDFVYNKATFLTGAPTRQQFPKDEGTEIAFIGRSNAGKSSALNSITNNKSLARTSKTPGRTQMLNFFSLDQDHRLVDLPGYGYATVPLAIKERWERTVNQYLTKRQCLKGLFIVMDIRHPLKPQDQALIEEMVKRQCALHILLTKSDKLSFGQSKNVLKKVETHIASYDGNITVQLFSSLNNMGVVQAREKLDGWLSS